MVRLLARQLFYFRRDVVRVERVALLIDFRPNTPSMPLVTSLAIVLVTGLFMIFSKTETSLVDLPLVPVLLVPGFSAGISW